MYGGERLGEDGGSFSAEFARGHYEQHVGAEGSIRVGDNEWAVDGFGLRDHSWGPRSWQAPLWYRWLTANFGADFGFVVSIITPRDGEPRTGGMVLTDGRYEEITHADLETDWTGEGLY